MTPEHSNEYQRLVEASKASQLRKMLAGWGQSEFATAAASDDGENLLNLLVGQLARLEDAEEQLSALKLPHVGDGEGRYQQGDHIIYTGDDGSLRIRGEIIENVEGWWLVRWLADSSTSIVRPSRILPTPPAGVSDNA